MTPVDQRVIDPGVGDCMTACIASLLDLPYEAVPRFREIQNLGEEGWWTIYWRFLKKEGYDFVGTFSNSGDPIIDFSELSQRCKGVNGFYMAVGPSPRYNCSHAIIIDAQGHCAHDPHPSRLGLPVIDHVDMVRLL